MKQTAYKGFEITVARTFVSKRDGRWFAHVRFDESVIGEFKTEREAREAAKKAVDELMEAQR